MPSRCDSIFTLRYLPGAGAPGWRMPPRCGSVFILGCFPGTGVPGYGMAPLRGSVRGRAGSGSIIPPPAVRPPRPFVQICFLQKVAKHAKERGERAEAGNRWPFRSLGPSLSLLAPSSQLFRISKFGFRIFVPPNRLCDLRVLLFKILFHARAPRTGKGSGVFFEKGPSHAAPTIDRKRLPTPWRVFVLFVSFVVTHPTATP